MRDGQGNKLPPEEVDKVKSIETDPDKGSLRRVSVDPGAGPKPSADAEKKPQSPDAVTAPKF
jgi:hypothetical protein